MIQVNFRDARPIYEQVRDGFRQLILSGALPADSRMPSVRELEAEGYIVSVPGRGSFVRERGDAAAARRRELLEELDSLVSELKLLGLSEEELAERVRGETHD